MRINAIRDKSADVTLDASELVCLGNVLYFYEKHYLGCEGASPAGPAFHHISKQVITARDLCQYGHMDGHSLATAAAHELAANPDGQLKKGLGQLLGSETPADGT